MPVTWPHMQADSQMVLVQYNPILRYGHPVNQLANHLAVTGMKINQCCWMTQFTTGSCAVGHMMHKWGEHALAACPHCRYDTEIYGPHPAMPRPCSTDKWVLEYQQTTNTTKIFRNRPQCHWRPQQTVQYVETQQTPSHAHGLGMTTILHLLGLI